jgi:hypothetical protein
MDKYVVGLVDAFQLSGVEEAKRLLPLTIDKCLPYISPVSRDRIGKKDPPYDETYVPDRKGDARDADLARQGVEPPRRHRERHALWLSDGEPPRGRRPRDEFLCRLRAAVEMRHGDVLQRDLQRLDRHVARWLQQLPPSRATECAGESVWAITVYDSDTQAFIRESARQSIDLYDIGGSIEVTVKNRADADTLTAVRTHLRTIADQFARGEFDKPFQTHGEIPPGVAAMQANAAAIAFRHQQPADGAAVRIETHDGELVQAVHAFLRYRIEEHRTGDPLAVKALNSLRRVPRGARIRSQRGAVSVTATRKRATRAMFTRCSRGEIAARASR